MFMIVLRQEYQFHQPRMHYQEHQHVHGAMPSIIELLLLDRSRDRSADGVTLQDLEGGNFVDAHHPDALCCQSRRIPIAPKDLLRSLLEPGIHPGCLPIAGAMGLQIDIVQDSPHRAWADASNNSIRHGLAGQVIARPMRDVQPFGHRFQTSEFNDLCPLHRSNLQITSRVALPLVSEQARKTQALVPLTGSPDGGFVAVELGSKDFAALAGRDSQNNTRTTHPEPRQRIAMGDPFQFGDVRGANRQYFGSASSHAVPPTSRMKDHVPPNTTDSCNLVQVLRPITLGQSDTDLAGVGHTG